MLGVDAMSDRIADACRRVSAAASPYRQTDGSYRFENRYRYWIIAP